MNILELSRSEAQSYLFEHGKCKNYPVGYMYPEPRQGLNLDAMEQIIAHQVCSKCPVQADCLKHALKVPETFGVWGGKSSEQRRHLTKRLKVIRAATNQS